jgi:predicted RNase H-like HicB family nuclease
VPANRPVCRFCSRISWRPFQGETLDEVNHNLHDVIEMLLEDGEPVLESEFIGVQNVAVA